MLRLAIPVFAATLLLTSAIGLAKRAPLDPVGDWKGAVSRRIKVRKERRMTGAAVVSMNLRDGAWISYDGESSYQGTYAPGRTKHVLTPNGVSECSGPLQHQGLLPSDVLVDGGLVVPMSS